MLEVYYRIITRLIKETKDLFDILVYTAFYINSTKNEGGNDGY